MFSNWLSTMTEVAVAATTEVPQSTSNLTNLPLVTKGLLTTGVGLLGVFLVLGILFGTIKLMQRIKTKESED